MYLQPQPDCSPICIPTDFILISTRFTHSIATLHADTCTKDRVFNNFFLETKYINKVYVKGQVTTNVSETISLVSCIQKIYTDCTSLLNAANMI